MIYIELPENKEQLNNLYENILKKINKKNTLGGLSLLQEGSSLQSKSKSQSKTSESEQYLKIKFPKKGVVNDLPIPVKIKTIGVDLNPDLNKTANVSKINPQEKLAIENKEVEKAEHLPFPTTRKERSYEKADDAYDKQVNAELKEQNQKNKQKILQGFSFLQKRSDDEIQDDTDFDKKNKEDSEKIADKKLKNVGKILKQMKKNIELKKKKTKENLINCKKNCSETCKRFVSLALKNESFSLCKIKCELACTENALNNMMN